MPVAIIFAALAAVIIWGASPVAAKIAVGGLPPMVVAILRTVIGGLAALPLVLAFRIPLPQEREQRQLLLISGFCGFVAFPILFTIGVNLTSANHASMILAALPIITGAIAMTWDKKLPKLLWYAGCIIALAGEAILIFTKTPQDIVSTSIKGDVIVLISNLFASLGYVAGGRLQQAGYPAHGTTFWGVILFAIFLLPFTPFFLSNVEWASVPIDAWLAVTYLAVAVTIIGYMLWYWSLGRGGIARIGLIQFLQPVSGVILAWILLNEGLSMSFILASVLILIGVWIAMKAK